MSRQFFWPTLPDGRQMRLNAASGAVEVYAPDGTTVLHTLPPAETVVTHTHSASGPLAFTVTATTVLVVVTASANVTDITPAGMASLGAQFGTVWVELTATAAITLASTTVSAVSLPASVAAGQSVLFQLVRVDA